MCLYHLHNCYNKLDIVVQLPKCMGSCPYDYTVAEEARCFCQTYSFILCCFATKIVINVENISHDMVKISLLSTSWLVHDFLLNLWKFLISDRLEWEIFTYCASILNCRLWKKSLDLLGKLVFILQYWIVFQPMNFSLNYMKIL